MTDDDESAALLTKEQRKYLIGEKDLDAASERALRGRIRQRLKRGIKDLTLLLGHLEPRDEDQVFDEIGQTDGIPFFLRRYVRNMIQNRGEETPSLVERGQAQGGILAIAIENAIERAFRVELTREHGHDRYGVDVNVDLTISITGQARRNIADLEYQLQQGELSFQELRQYYAEGKITLKELRQLTRDEEVAGEPTSEYREELLSQPVPILEGEPPEDYIRIKNTNTENQPTKRLHEREIMPPEYYIRFDEEDWTAVVLEEIGERAVERYDNFERVDT